MNSIQFVKAELTSFIRKFPKTRVRLEIDSDSNSHYIEIVPNEIYKLDSSYIAWESEIFDNFVEKYPDENIYFISDDAIIGLDRIDFELVGSSFTSILNVNYDCFYNFNQVVSSVNIISEPLFLGLSTYIPSSEIITGSFESFITSSIDNSNNDINEFSTIIDNSKLETKLENSFPLAA